MLVQPVVEDLSPHHERKEYVEEGGRRRQRDSRMGIVIRPLSGKTNATGHTAA